MGKYDNYICTTLHKRHMLPGPTPEERDKLAAEGLRIGMEHVLWIDEDVIPGAYYGESTWIWPSTYANQISFEEASRRSSNQKPMFPHAHDFPELLSWWGTDPDHPEDTTAMGMIMGDEEIPLETSWVGYIPAGMMHMPTRPKGGRVTDKPVLHWTSGPGVYTREAESHDEKDTQHQEVPVPGKPKLSTTENLKYFVLGGQQKPEDVKKPDYMRRLDPAFARHIAYIDETVIPGAEFGCDTMFLMPGGSSAAGEVIMDPHTLPHGTSITLTAMNYADITDLCAEAELWIGGEKHVINRSFGAYIPPDVEQGPLIVRNNTAQLFLMISHPVGEGVRKYRGG